MDVSASPAYAGGGSPNPPSPPLGSLGKELSHLIERPQKVAISIGVIIGLAVPLALTQLVLELVRTGRIGHDEVIPAIWLAAAACTGSYAASVATIAFLPLAMLSKRDRMALAAHSWIGAREVRRTLGRATAAMQIPTNAAMADAWLAAHADTPELRHLRFETLLLAKRYDEARSLIAAFPRGSPLDEFKIAEAVALVDDQQVGNADLAAVRAALANMPKGMDRIEATASLSVFEARRLIGTGDWRAPLIAVRPLIPGSDLELLVRDLGMPIFTWLSRAFVLPLAAFTVFVALAVTFMALA